MLSSAIVHLHTFWGQQNETLGQKYYCSSISAGSILTQTYIFYNFRLLL